MTSQLFWILLLVQIAMGAFDTIYHHELTERLAWRASQAHELALHAVRNLLYAAVFIMIGWFETHGAWAFVLMAVLVVEVVITLADFVEEDLSRALPASERVNHALLALNYGAILCILLPQLLQWSRDATALKPAFYGFWSILTAVSAAGVVISGLRDHFASRRAGRLVLGRAAELVAAMPQARDILITGATGFIGSRLVEALAGAGHRVTILTRDRTKAAKLVPPFRLVTSLDQIPNDAAIDTIVNLAGEPIADAPWTAARRRKILRSRLKVTRDVVRLVERLDTAPVLLISGSAIGWYGLWQDQALTERDSGRDCFSRHVCVAWERMAMRAERRGVRVVRLRIGLVLGTQGGMLSRLLMPFEFGLGGPIGSGRQWMSWIERDDLVRLIAHIVATPKLVGAVNATAPTPVRNADFARELGRALRRPAFMPMPAALLGLLGDFADELLLGGQRVLPAKALTSGFEFCHHTLRSALVGMIGCREQTPRALLPCGILTPQPSNKPAAKVTTRPLRHRERGASLLSRSPHPQRRHQLDDRGDKPAFWQQAWLARWHALAASETPMSSLTQDLGRFVADLSLRQIPAEGCATARTGIADCFGVLIAGARDPEIALVDRELGHSNGAALASLIPSGARRSPDTAALVNGVAAHVLDYDDVSLDGHPSAVLVPAILAQGETSGSSGAEMLTAYVAGYEVWAELLLREPIPLHRKGWHPSAVLGPIAAAAACAKLRGLDATQAATAMAIAASMSGGLVANFGTMTKSFQVGRAAQSGVIAARLAQAGLTASLDALEHPAGLLMALSVDGKATLDRPFDAAQKEWHIVGHGLSIKRYPICYATHRSIDAALDLVARFNLTPEKVERIHVSIGKTQMLMLRNSRPQTGLEAKFSMQFAMAAALCARNVGLRELTDDFVRRPEVQAIFPRVLLEGTAATKAGSNFAPADAVEITTTDGAIHKSGPVEFAKGSHQRPLSRDELWAKFADCLGSQFPDAKKARAFENLMMFDRLNGAGDVALVAN